MITLPRTHPAFAPVCEQAEAEETAAAEPDTEDTEPGASLVPNDKHWLKQETVTVTQELTQKEKAEYADCMANLDNEIQELEAERDRISKSLKKRIDAMEEERRQLSKVVREGKEEREIFCDKCADYNACEMVWTDAHPPHDEVKRQKMTSEERQFPLEKKSRPDAQPQATEVQPSEDVAEAAPEGEDLEAVCAADAPCDTAADENNDVPSCSGCGQQYTADGSCDGCVDFTNYTSVTGAESSQLGAVQ